MKLKCLQLDAWMTPGFLDDGWDEIFQEDLAETVRLLPPCDPVVGRPGRYLRGKEAWMELPDGRAFKIKASLLRYELDLLDAERFNPRQVKALQLLTTQGLATKAQKKLLYLCLEVAGLRETGRRAGVDGLRLSRENP